MGAIYLNRPNHFNALSCSMVQLIHKILKEWENSKTHAIWTSNVEKVFSSGGDVKSICSLTKGPSGLQFGVDASKAFHKLCYLIATYQKPFIAIQDGLTLGGAGGLASNSKYSIATENTILAFPETAIGNTPDTGSIYKLSKLKLGLYLALTGYKLKGGDVFLAGLATHFVPSCRLHLLNRELNKSNGSDIDDILSDYHTKTLIKKSSLEPYMEKISYCFSASTFEEIIDRLKNDESEWSKATQETLERKSPTALKLTKKAFDIAPKKNIEECLKMGHSLFYATLNTDLWEGVRAQLIDKDYKPVWQPKTLNEVSDEYISQLFSLLPKEEKLEL